MNDEKLREKVLELMDTDTHKYARHCLQEALAEVFMLVDEIGMANQKHLEENGEPAAHVSQLMIEMAMNTITNTFARINAEDRPNVLKTLQEFLVEVPRIVSEEELAEAEPQGNA